MEPSPGTAATRRKAGRLHQHKMQANATIRTGSRLRCALRCSSKEQGHPTPPTVGCGCAAPRSPAQLHSNAAPRHRNPDCCAARSQPCRVTRNTHCECAKLYDASNQRQMGRGCRKHPTHASHARLATDDLGSRPARPASRLATPAARRGPRGRGAPYSPQAGETVSLSTKYRVSLRFQAHLAPLARLARVQVTAVEAHS